MRTAWKKEILKGKCTASTCADSNHENVKPVKSPSEFLALWKHPSYTRAITAVKAGEVLLSPQLVNAVVDEYNNRFSSSQYTNTSALATLLKEMYKAGADPAGLQDKPALHKALAVFNIPLVQVLVEAGARIHPGKRQPQPLLHVLISTCWNMIVTRVVRILLQLNNMAKDGKLQGETAYEAHQGGRISLDSFYEAFLSSSARMSKLLKSADGAQRSLAYHDLRAIHEELFASLLGILGRAPDKCTLVEGLWQEARSLRRWNGWHYLAFNGPSEGFVVTLTRLVVKCGREQARRALQALQHQDSGGQTALHIAVRRHGGRGSPVFRSLVAAAELLSESGRVEWDEDQFIASMAKNAMNKTVLEYAGSTRRQVSAPSVPHVDTNGFWRWDGAPSPPHTAPPGKCEIASYAGVLDKDVLQYVAAEQPVILRGAQTAFYNRLDHDLTELHCKVQHWTTNCANPGPRRSSCRRMGRGKLQSLSTLMPQHLGRRDLNSP